MTRDITRPLLLCAFVSWSACTNGNLPLPLGHQLRCQRDDQCPSGLKCDKEIADGRCVETIAPSPTVSVTTDELVGTRKEPFVLTATATNTARYAWEYTVGERPTVVLPETTAVVEHTFTELKSADFCAPDCEEAVAVQVKVTVYSPEGKVASAETTLVVTNDAPIADFGDDLFISEENVALVTLDYCGGGSDDECTSSDPDDDDIEFEGFRQVGGPDVGPLGDAGIVTFAPPQGPHRPLVFEGVVSDGIVKSVGRITVNRGSHGWIAVGTIDSTFRVHPDFRAVQKWVSAAGTGGVERFFGPVEIEPDGQGGWWVADAYQSPARTLLVHLDSTLRENVSDRLELSGIGRVTANNLALPIKSFVPPRAGRSGCVTFRRDAFDGGGLPSGFARYVPGQAFTIAHSSTKPDGGFHLPVAVLPVGATGNCWAVRLGDAEGFNAVGGAVAQLTEQGQWLDEQTLGGYPAASAVEPDGTLWVAERYPIPLPGGGFASPVEDQYRTVLTKHPPTPGAAVQSFDFEDSHLTALAPALDGGVWAIDSQEDVVVRVRSDGVLSFTDAVVGGGTAFGASALQLDPVSGDVWTIDPETQALQRFTPLADGGMALMTFLDGDSLPEGQNKKSFAGDLALDPLTGNVATFVGADNVSYQRFVVVPPHGRRIERLTSVQNGLNSRLRGDPASGTHWVVDGFQVRRIDGRGRVMVEVDNTFMDRAAQVPAMVVDRAGRAWVVTIDGMPELRSILPDGSDGDSVPLPFLPQGGFISGRLTGSTLHEMGCFFATDGLARVDFAQAPPTVTRLTLSGEDVLSCAVNSSGDVWAFTTNSAVRGDIHARLFRRSELGSNVSIVVDGQSADFTFIQGAVADEDGQTAYFGTWHFDTYFADLLRVRVGDVAPTVLTVLQGNVMGVNVLGIPTSLSSRRVCDDPVPACLELWLSNRVNEVRRYDTSGEELERFTIGQREGVFDLVP